MIVATRLSAVWQVAGVAAAALCCYLVSQSVAAERAGLNKVDHQIAAAHDDIAKLETEIGVRARMGQLESWNRNVLALQAPRPSQFVSSGVQLASLYGRKGQPALRLDPAIASQQGSATNVSYQPAVPQAPSAVPPVAPQASVATPASDADAPQPLLRTATFVRPAPDRLGAAQPSAPSAAPVMQKASFEPTRATAAPIAKASPKHVAPTRVAHADPLRALLPDDIGALAAREAHGAKGEGKSAR
jgi:hypothetical protein